MLKYISIPINSEKDFVSCKVCTSTEHYLIKLNANHIISFDPIVFCGLETGPQSQESASKCDRRAIWRQPLDCPTRQALNYPTRQH